jgi:hypothetical protein
MMRKCAPHQSVRGQIFTAVPIEFKGLPSSSLIFTEQMQTRLCSLFIEEIVGVCDPKVEYRVIHIDDAFSMREG